MSVAGWPQVFEPILTRLCADTAEHFGTTAVRLVPVESQDRRFSYLLRVGVRGADDGEPRPHLFVKVFKPRVIDGAADAMRERVIRDFETTRRVYASMRHSVDLGVVRPVACYPEHLAIVTEQVDGPTLLEFLNAQAKWFPGGPQRLALQETMARIGRWLRAFQSTALEGGYVTIAQLHEYADERLRHLAKRAARFTGGDRTRILRHLELLGPQVAPADLRAVAVHSDMSLGNIVVSGGRIVVLDFAMAKTGTRLHDLTRLYLQLDLLGVKPHFRGVVVRRLQQALITGFDSSLTVDEPLFRFHLLLHRINHLLTLSIRRTSVPATVYNRAVRRQHHRWIARELEGHAGVRGPR